MEPRQESLADSCPPMWKVIQTWTPKCTVDYRLHCCILNNYNYSKQYTLAQRNTLKGRPASLTLSSMTSGLWWLTLANISKFQTDFSVTSDFMTLLLVLVSHCLIIVICGHSVGCSAKFRLAHFKCFHMQMGGVSLESFLSGSFRAEIPQSFRTESTF